MKVIVLTLLPTRYSIPVLFWRTYYSLHSISLTWISVTTVYILGQHRIFFGFDIHFCYRMLFDSLKKSHTWEIAWVLLLFSSRHISNLQECSHIWYSGAPSETTECYGLLQTNHYLWGFIKAKHTYFNILVVVLDTWLHMIVFIIVWNM